MKPNFRTGQRLSYFGQQRDKLAETPNKANYFVAVLRRPLFWVIERGWLKDNPAQKITRLQTGPGYRAWTDA
jgi:hypothetical protein